MQPQTKLAVKLKTLTASLAIATGFGIANTFAYTATSDDGELIQATANSIEVFLTDYKEYVEVKSGTDGAGTFNAKDFASIDDTGDDITQKIVGNKNLTNTEIKQLYNATKTFVPANKAAIVKTYGYTPNLDDEEKDKDNPNLQLLHILLGAEDSILMDEDGSDAQNTLNLLTSIDSNVTADVADSVFNASQDYSTDPTKSAAISTLNKAITSMYSAFDKASGTDSADTNAAKIRRQALLNYMAAYVDAGAVDVDTIDESNKANMTTGVAKLIADAITAANKKVEEGGKGLVKITTDAQLKLAVEFTDANLEKAVTAVKAITHGNSVNFTKGNAALVKHYAAANKLTGDAKIKAYEEASAKALPNPSSLGNASAVQSTKAVMQNIAKRTDMLMAGVNSGYENMFADGSVWLRTTFVSSDTDAKESSPAYKQKSTGFGIGVDQQLNEKFDFGLSYNFVKSAVDGKDGFLQEDDVKTYAFGAYLSMTQENMFADAQINYLKNKVDGKRGIGADDAIDYETYKFDGSS